MDNPSPAISSPSGLEKVRNYREANFSSSALKTPVFFKYIVAFIALVPNKMAVPNGGHGGRDSVTFVVVTHFGPIAITQTA